MDVGTDADGRPITYDETTEEFSIGGIVTNIERLSAYDRGGQVNWVSDEVRDWAREFNHSRQEFASQQYSVQAEAAARRAAEQQAAARRARHNAQGYNPDSIVRFASGLKGIGMALIVLLTIGGAANGLVIGLVVGSQAPVLILIAPAVFGFGGFLLGYLLSAFIKLAADMMLAVVQIEMNTRGSDMVSRVA